MPAYAGSRQACQKAVIHGVMPLGKGMTLPGEACLVANRFLTR